MTDASREPPELHFFRKTPKDWLLSPPLPAALQTFETALISASLGRYHTCLVLCVSSIEALLKAELKIPVRLPGQPRGGDRYLEGMLKAVAQTRPHLRPPDKQSIATLRDARNRMTHYGHSPADNQPCADLLVKIGWPLIEELLRTCFLFDLSDTGENDGAFVPALNFGWAAMRRAMQDERTRDLPPELRLAALTHAVRWLLQPAFLSSTEASTLLQAEQNLARPSVQEALSELDSSLRNPWTTNCPICSGVGSLVLDLKFDGARLGGVSRAVCASCDFSLPAHGDIASVIFAPVLEANEPQIRRTFALPDPH